MFAIQCGPSLIAKAQARIDVVKFPDDWTHIDAKGNEVLMEAIIYRIWRLPGARRQERTTR